MEKRPAIGGPERCERRKNAANVGNNNEKAQRYSHGQENISSGINDKGDKKEYILGVDSSPLSNFPSFPFFALQNSGVLYYCRLFHSDSRPRGKIEWN